MEPSEHDQLIAFVEQMPAFPKSVQKLLQLTANIDISAKDIVQVIECDPVLTARILKVINSAFYGAPQKITSVQRAVVHIGLNTIKSLALGVAAIGMLHSRNRANFNAGDFLLHTLTTAAISRKLAERLHLSQLECGDCFVGGLLHDFGKMVFAEYKPEQFKLALAKSKNLNIALPLTELEFIGFDHAQAVGVLAESWRLPEFMISALAHHHKPDGTILGDCIFAANQISKQLQFGDGGNPVVEDFPEALVERFGMPLMPLITDLGDMEPIKAEALSFIHQ